MFFVGELCLVTVGTVDFNRTKLNKPLRAKRVPFVVDEVLGGVNCQKVTLFFGQKNVIQKNP